MYKTVPTQPRETVNQGLHVCSGMLFLYAGIHFHDYMPNSVSVFVKTVRPLRKFVSRVAVQLKTTRVFGLTNNVDIINVCSTVY